jgi:N-acetylmuramoyl-L-alanine amidase
MLTTLSCIAMAVYFEARGESALGQRAVAEVIMNRVNDPRWPSSACAVVKQPRQFSFYKAGKKYKTDPSLYARSEAVARDAIAGDTLNTQALYYHSTKVLPVWRHDLEVLGTIGSHVFYTDKSLAPVTSLRPKLRPKKLERKDD